MMQSLLYGFISLGCLYCLDVSACGTRRGWSSVVRKEFIEVTESSTAAIKKSSESFEYMKGNISEISVQQALLDVESAINELEKCKERLEKKDGSSLTQMQVCTIARKLRLMNDRKFYLTSESGIADAEARGYYDKNTAEALISMLPKQ